MLETQRLILRQWRESDWPALARLNADSEVMRYFPAPLSREESDDMARKLHELIVQQGFGFWAVELKQTGELIGFTGLHRQEQAGIPNIPMVEVGWRLAREHWGRGYAPEAAQASLLFAFETLSEPEVYAFTTLTNTPSRRVMEKLGMQNTGQDFNHPKLESGHPLVRHCLYRISRQQWLKEQNK